MGKLFNIKRLLPVVVSALLLFSVVAVTGCSGGDEQQPTMQIPVADTSEDTPAETGGEAEAEPEEEVIYAPDFTVTGLDGTEMSLSDYRGSFVLLNFWATWCPPCKSEMPMFEEISGEWADRGLVILGVSVGESESTVQKFIDQYGYTFPIALDPDHRVSSQYAVTAFPTTYFVDEDGIIQGRVTGAFPDREYLETALESLMQ